MKLKGTKNPSPRSSNARKPLLNITNTCHGSKHSSVENPKPLVPTPSGLSRPSSSNSIKGVKEDGRSETPVERIRNKKSIGLLGRSAEGKESMNYCVNHRMRKAMHRILISDSLEYYCLECSLYYAKQGHKVVALQQSHPQPLCSPKPAPLLQETKNYILECKRFLSDTRAYMNKNSCLLAHLSSTHKQDLQKKQAEKARRIRAIEEEYERQVEQMTQEYQEKEKYLKDTERNVKKLGECVGGTEVDVVNNMGDIGNGIQEKEFRGIMDRYWKRLKQGVFYLEEQSKILDGIEGGVELKSIPTSEIKSSHEKNGDEFTFSKKERLQTPESQRFKGVRFANSQGQTINNSSMRESIVDMKYKFQ